MTQNTYVQRTYHPIPVRSSRPAPITRDVHTEETTIIPRGGLTAEQSYKLRPRSSWQSFALICSGVFIVGVVLVYTTMSTASAFSQQWKYGDQRVFTTDHRVPNAGYCRFTGEILSNGNVLIYQSPYDHLSKSKVYSLGLAVDPTPQPVMITFDQAGNMVVRVASSVYTYRANNDGTFNTSQPIN